MLNKRILRHIKTSIHIPVCDVLSTNSISGIRATIFGATGFIGHSIAGKLGSISSDMVFPHNNRWVINDQVKRLKLMGNLGMTYIMNEMNFKDPRAIRRSMEHSNVVINCIGPRKTVTNFSKFKEANIDIPQQLAKQARLSGVKRFIHLSSLGVDSKSLSMDLKTKYIGEKAVLDEFPDATILRLGTTIGLNDHFQKNFRKQASLFVHFVPVFSSLTAKRCPITDHDVSLAVLNSIKLTESAGKIYQVCGPHQYTLKEIYEVMMNILQKPMSYPKMNRSFFLKLSYLISNQYLCYDDLLKEEIDMIPIQDKDIYGVEDLMLRTASVIPTLKDIMAQYGDTIGFVKDDANL